MALTCASGTQGGVAVAARPSGLETARISRFKRTKCLGSGRCLGSLAAPKALRVSIHACNHAAHTVGCSAATFVFARTMPHSR